MFSFLFTSWPNDFTCIEDDHIKGLQGFFDKLLYKQTDTYIPGHGQCSSSIYFLCMDTILLLIVFFFSLDAETSVFIILPLDSGVALENAPHLFLIGRLGIVCQERGCQCAAGPAKLNPPGRLPSLQDAV